MTNAYNAIVADVLTIDPNNPPAIFATGPVSLTITPPAATNVLPAQPNHLFTVKLTKGGNPLVGYLVNVAASFGTLNNAVGTTDATGVATFTVSSASAGTANITASATVTVPGAIRYPDQNLNLTN